jgi:hypothetical protein
MKGANRREPGEFDRLVGSLGKGESQLLSDLISDIRDVVIDWCQDDELALTLLVERAAASGYRNVHPAPADVELALRLLSSIVSARLCKPGEMEKLFLGARDASRQEGVRKPRRPEINDWILAQLQVDPSDEVPRFVESCARLD